MSSLEKPIPGAFWVTLAVSAGLFAFVCWDQSYWWRSDAEYSFGWLTPAFALFVIYDRRELMRQQLADCAAPSKSMRPAFFAGHLPGVVAAIALAAGAALFSLGALSRARNGASNPGTFGIALGAGAMALACIYLCAPAPEGGRSDWRRAGRLAGLFIFPAGIWLLSAPLVSALNGPLRLWLLNWVVGAVAFIFRILHLPIVRHGNIFTVPRGDVAVVEACIGIRSLTGLGVTSLFLGSAFLAPIRRPLLFVCAVALALIDNLFRVLFLNLWAYWRGPEAITATLHDTVGWVAIGIAVAVLLALVHWWSPDRTDRRPPLP